ncbi:rCG43539, isoform CRA_c [Rattus norvegicus]|uniref:Succinate dehydrogenase assembly factor 4, mitochondrial n=2 Tax=Rattus norvegicus TaxID=10116 RepID=A6JJB3_RAT|nr:succinate dehydrogenase assembly factor 4, mitochondrial isoform 2 [Rattus norvegicus]EDM18620.1 rCG43539, isoform CRA_c [Rattus norvegicus]|eukprot:XP_003750718.1 PREDICTED: succinate dehydrogenase assembly factor 4, mitochondrial isoform X1 [Rattus norvegicus]
MRGRRLRDRAGRGGCRSIRGAWRRGRWFSRSARLLGSSLLNHSLRKKSSQEGKPEPSKQALKKSKLPVGRFDSLDDSPEERDPLQKFPDDVNPVTKEKGGPRGPEPTRYGDWERKGRCIDF